MLPNKTAEYFIKKSLIVLFGKVHKTIRRIPDALENYSLLTNNDFIRGKIIRYLRITILFYYI